MISRNDALDALTKCVGYDPIHAPRKDVEVMASAWAEHFALYPNLTRRHVLDAVRDYYCGPQRPWPQPADISTIARAKMRDESDRAPLELTDGGPASEEHRKKCLAEIRRIISRQETRWSVPKAQ